MSTKKVIPMSEKFTSVADLQNECNFTERDLPGFLKSLEASGDAAAHVTKGTFDKLSLAEFKKEKDKLGKLKFKLDADGTDTAWINGKKEKVSFK
jgi:hypothetical protein